MNYALVLKKIIDSTKKMAEFITRKPLISLVVACVIYFGFFFVSLGSTKLLLDFLSRRPLFHFGIYLIVTTGLILVYCAYLKIKNFTVSNDAFNQLIKDLSRSIKATILLFISLYMTTYGVTKIITVYFNSSKQEYRVSGSHNTFYSGSFVIPEFDKDFKLSQEERSKHVITEEKNSEEVPLIAETTLSEQNKLEKLILKESDKKVIKTITIPKIYLSQEYPSGQGYNYLQSINLSSGKPAVMNFKNEEQPMWFGIGNMGLENVNNPTLFLQFDGSFEIKTKPGDSVGWLEMDPNRQYNVRTRYNMQPGGGLKLFPLFVKFPNSGIYAGEYTITSDNNLPISGRFTIDVVAG